MHTDFALLCFVVVIHWLIFPYPSGLLHWHCGNLTIAPVPAKQPWWIWINTSCEFIMNDCITTTKQSTTKPCAYFLGYTVCDVWHWRGFTPSEFIVLVFRCGSFRCWTSFYFYYWHYYQCLISSWWLLLLLGLAHSQYAWTTTDVGLLKRGIWCSVIAHFPGCFCPGLSLEYWIEHSTIRLHGKCVFPTMIF